MTAWSASVTVSAGGFDLALSIEGDDTPVALIGPNGSGKTTALRAIAGAVAVSDARVEIGNRVLDCTEREIHVPMQDRGIGYVPQGYGLFPHLTVMENVEFGLTVGARRDSATSRTERVGAMLSRLGCESLAHRRVDRQGLRRARLLEHDVHDSSDGARLRGAFPGDGRRLGAGVAHLRSGRDHRPSSCIR